ncbi:DEKNAAC103563 [Brettanomyces naardenensis]|uniref:RNA helicase n=1 Tax=Brettanomyces naardenensis TaxID=13370 RepID=A0A448YNJ3_BRENA|nr:DEKNAAC103563 [Brettanomyces naardenensis]
MDIFRALSRGASLKKSKNITSDYSMPTKAQLTVQSDKEKRLEDEVDKELDFFKQKSHKSDEDDDDSEVTIAKDIPPALIQTQEDAAKLRKSYGAKVSGEDIPLPIGSFEDLVTRFDLNRKLLDNLIQEGFKEPTPIQCEAIPAAMYDRDIIGCAPTGSGKTLAFLIPLIQGLIDKKAKTTIRGLIVSPTKELAYQIFAVLNKLAKGIPTVKVGYLNKSIAAKLRNKVITSSKFDILVSTPLRLIDLVEDGSLDLSKVQQLVLDEADKMFESNFVEQTDRILTACSNPKIRRSIFSATITSSVEEIAQSIMTYPERIIIGHKEAANTSIDQKLVFCGDEHGKLVAIREMILQGEFKPPVIIFLQSISRAKALFHELLYDGLNVDVIHAERTQTQREMILEKFKSGELWCLICTDVLARGVDFKGINLVINYDVPNSAQAYVHRIGRTGRAGRAGKAVTFYTKVDMDGVKTIVNVMKQSGSIEGVPDWLREGVPKLSKSKVKSMKRKPVERKQISTVPAVIRNKRRKKRDMIDGSKRRKVEEEKNEEVKRNEGNDTK